MNITTLRISNFRPGQNAKSETKHYSMIGWRSSALCGRIHFFTRIMLARASWFFEHVYSCTPLRRFAAMAARYTCCKIQRFLALAIAVTNETDRTIRESQNRPYPDPDRTKNVRGEFSRGSDVRTCKTRWPNRTKVGRVCSVQDLFFYCFI